MTLSNLTQKISSSITSKLDSVERSVFLKIESANASITEKAVEARATVSDTFARASSSARSDWTLGVSSGAGRGAEAQAPRQAVSSGAKLEGQARGLDPVQGGAKVYDKHGDTKYDLKNPEQTKQLIAASPQLDNLGKTEYDSVRCGGAAMMNGLLLDGNHAKNAAAIEKTASQAGVSLSREERSALTAMKAGSMTPKQAATTQELLVKLGTAGGANMPNGHVRYTNSGLTPVGMAELGAKLRKNGGFSDSKQVGFHAQKMSNGATHWTVSVLARNNARNTADSWPGNDGYARVGTTDSTSRLNVNGAPNPDFRGEFHLTNEADGRVSYEVAGRITAADGSDTGRYERYAKSASASEAPAFSTYSRSVHLRSNGQPI